jgi:hypothetical protein
MNLHTVDPKALCRDSWWICDRATFNAIRVEREKVWRPAFGSQPVATTPSGKEQSFMDQKGRNQ